MTFIDYYDSPLGKIRLECSESALSGLWFEGQKYFAGSQNADKKKCSNKISRQTKEWLSIYFDGKNPSFTPPLLLCGTSFQTEVWELLQKIPYGRTVTYGDIAEQVAQKRGLAKMSAQAVGGAVGHNPISIIVPCHRVVGKDGSLTGYAGGIERKAALLKLENTDMKRYYIPKRGTAL